MNEYQVERFLWLSVLLLDNSYISNHFKGQSQGHGIRFQLSSISMGKYFYRVPSRLYFVCSHLDIFHLHLI